MRKVAHFRSLYREGANVLDVGVSSETKEGPSIRNYFLKNFAYDPKYYTGLGIQNLDGMERLFPGKRFVRYPGGRFPFADQEFGWVFSNAVIEHVGGRKKQLEFINEMLRVGRYVYFTTPNKYFPFETHTNAFFLHWNDGLFHRWCDKTGRGRRKQNLRLLSFRSLKKLMQVSNATSYVLKKDRFMGLTMTITVICRSVAVPMAANRSARMGVSQLRSSETLTIASRTDEPFDESGDSVADHAASVRERAAPARSKDLRRYDRSN
jgi:SAM-dependent methyltransferase